MASDEDLLRRWCEGDEAAGDEWWGRPVGIEVDQRMVAGCAKGEAKACERFVGRYLARCTAAQVEGLLARGRLAASCARQCEDLALLARYAEGNKGAGDALFRRYYPVLDRFVASKVGGCQEAADLVQEIFRDLSKQRRQITSFRPFMFKVAANKIGAWFTKKYSRPVDTGTSGISDLPGGIGLETREQQRREHKLVVMALQGLPLDEQMVIELYTWEEFTAEDVAKIFGFQVHNVRHMLRHAKQKMREFVAAHAGAPAASSVELAKFVAELREQIRDHVPPS